MLTKISSQAESTSTMRQRKQSVGGFIFLFDSFAVLGDSFIHEWASALSARGFLPLLEGVVDLPYLLMAIGQLKILARNAIYLLWRIAFFDALQPLFMAPVVLLNDEWLFTPHGLMLTYIGRLINFIIA